MKTNRVAIKDLDGVSLYYAIDMAKGIDYDEQDLRYLMGYRTQYETFEDVEHLLKEYAKHIEYDATFQEYIVTSRVDENIFAISALLPEAIVMCAAKVIYKGRDGLDIPACLIDNW